MNSNDSTPKRSSVIGCTDPRRLHSPIAWWRRSVPLMVVIWFLLSLAPVQGGAALGIDVEAEGIDLSPWTGISNVDVDGHFTENLGQWDAPIAFVTESTFGRAMFGPDGVTYDVVGTDGGHRVKVAFASEGPVEVEGMDDLGYDTNYFIGDDPDRWVTGARSFGALLYEDVWPGVDLRYYHSGGALKYDVLIDAEADPTVVQFDVVGAEGLRAYGDRLDIELSSALSLQDRDLVAWYANGETEDVRFQLYGNGYGFDVEKEPGRAMVIDPVVVHSSTFLGGTYSDTAADVEVDVDGNIYVASYTGSTDFPVTPGAYSEEVQAADVAVTKFNHNCSEVIWSTFVGGSSWDFISGLEVHKGQAYIMGTTWSSDFPTTEGALNSAFNLGQNNYQMDIYVAKLNVRGDALLYSTYVGGSHTEAAGDIKVRKGEATVVGQTQSSDFPTESGPYGGVHGDGFLFTLNENGSRIVDTMFWGGFGSEFAIALEFDKLGDIVVGGRTSSMGFQVTAGAFQMTRPSFNSGFVTRYSPREDRVHFSTYLGGGAAASVSDITIDEDLNVYIGGTTSYGGPGVPFITTLGAFDSEYNGRTDAFLAKMSPNGTSLNYCTLLGGDGEDYLYDIEVDDDGNLVAVGSVGDGTNYTVTHDSHDPNWSGESEGFIFVLNGSGTAPVYSSFHGGLYGDSISSVEIDSVDNLIVAGSSDSIDLPITGDGYQRGKAGDFDVFVSIVGDLMPTSAPRALTAVGGEGHIDLEWEGPLYDYGYPVKRFLLLRGLSEDDLRFHADLGLATTFVDDDVEWGVRYHYAVIASNGKGHSPSSNVVSARSVTVPDPPFNMTGTARLDSVYLEWEPPGFTGGLSITGYLLYRTAEGDHLEVVTPLPPDPFAFEDLAIKDGTNYTYTLTAVNEYGESRDFASVTLRTTDVPSPPHGLDHIYGDLFIRLTWELPEDDFGLPITGYSVYRGDGNGPMELVGEVAAPTRLFMDTQVTVGTLYEYWVTAENAKGMSGPSEGIDAMAMVPPGPPQDVEATASEHFVRITWSPPGFDGASTVLGYRIYLGMTADDATCLGGPNVNGIGVTQMAFLHDIPYDSVVRHYFVTAVNAEGESDPSPVTATIMYQVPGTPEDLEVVWGDGELNLVWSPPTSDGGTPIFKYTLYRRAEGEEEYRALVTLSTGTLAYLDADARNGVEHTYRITATNLAGESEPSDVVSAVPAGLPGSPRDLLAVGGNGNVHLSWQGPMDPGGHPISGFRVYRRVDGGEMTLLVELGPGVTEFIDEEVEIGLVHTYAVSVSTDVGESARSDMASAMPYGPPGQPHGLGAYWIDGYVQLSWSSPLDDGNSAVTRYYLYRHDWEEGNLTELTEQELSYMDHDVEQGRSYNYTVYALNEAGKGAGGLVDITVPLPEPKPPEDSQTTPWALLVVVLVLTFVAVALVVMRGRGGIPGQAIL